MRQQVLCLDPALLFPCLLLDLVLGCAQRSLRKMVKKQSQPHKVVPPTYNKLVYKSHFTMVHAEYNYSIVLLGVKKTNKHHWTILQRRWCFLLEENAGEIVVEAKIIEMLLT